MHVVIAYRWGWTNNGGYIVTIKQELEDAIAHAFEEADSRGGKYGCAVYDKEGDLKHYEASGYGEDKPFLNTRIEMFERVGNRIAPMVENSETVTAEEVIKIVHEAQRDIDRWHNHISSTNIDKPAESK